MRTAPFGCPTRWVWVLVLTLVCGAHGASAPPAQEPPAGPPPPDTLVTGLTPERLLDLLRAEGYAAELAEDGSILWKIDSYRTMLTVRNEGLTILFQAAFRDSTANLERVNEWNRTRRFSRSYLDADGDPCLASDLDVEGGVTEARIKDFLKTCRYLFMQWYQEVVMK